MSKNYILNIGVTLSAVIHVKVKKIADRYYKETNKKITVTSGTRTSQSQADAMYSKLSAGDKLTVYKNQSAATKIKKAYLDGIKAKKSKADIIVNLKSEIDDQIKKGIYISKHLKKGAIDVRSRDMTKVEKAKFKKAAKGVATIVILETTPPHFHLQF